MSLYITSLNSGSNGNCYYIANETEAVLVDAGLSCREIEKRMKRLGLDMQKIKAVFVSHEHSDHIRGIPSLLKKYRFPVYITTSTLNSSGLCLDENLVVSFVSNETVAIGDLAILGFPKLHDACDPHSFIISCNGAKVGVFTDIGHPCQHVIKHFKDCHAAFLEANYDDDMLDRGSYPYHLKKRIRGGNGHLSNKQALNLFKAHKPPFMSHLLLSHLSNNNNCPDLVRSLFNDCAGAVKTVVASRFEETPVYYISASSKQKIRFTRAQPIQQLSFGFA